MATRPMKTITGLPGLEGNTYTFVQIDDQLATAGKAADAKAVGDELAEINETLPTKANVDGSYEQMTVGNAEQLVATVGIEDKVPYNFRTSGGANDIGDREVDKIIGGTVAWNQRADKSKYINITKTDYTITANGDGSLTVTIINTLESAVTEYLTANASPSYFRVPNGHKFAVLDANNVPTGFEYRNGYTGTSLGFNSIKTQSESQGYVFIGIKIPAGTTAQTFKIAPQLFDLTQMFGSTIADYIYSLETSTPGAGVAFFRSLFPAPFYAYDTGTLMHVQTSAHKTTGFNQWDEEWLGGYYANDGTFTAVTGCVASKNRIPVVPSTTYYFHGAARYTSGVKVIFYDASNAYISHEALYVDNTFTTPAGCTNILFYTYGATGISSYDNDICINLHWDGERDGEYEPYEERTYPLDSDLVLRGIPKLDANNSLYYDGDEYASDGTVTRKYGIMDLGTLEWIKNGDTIQFYAYPTETGVAGTLNAILSSAKYNITSRSAYDGVDGTISIRSTNIWIADSTFETAAALKAALNGVYLVYELATPTTESADPYQNPQIVNDWGTEEYVDSRTVPIPVGHDTTYRANLRAKLEMAPDSPADGDGDYIVRQTNGENAYVKLVIPTELPTAPTTDGTYHLKCTVASGTATLSWESDT